MTQEGPSGKKTENKSQNTATAEGHGEPAKVGSEDRFQFERLIAGFSSTIIGLPIEDLKEGMGIWLEQFARFLDVDRIAVSEMGKDGHSWAHFQSYSDPSLPLPPIPPLVDIKPVMPAVESALKRGEIFVINSVLDDLPASARPLPLVKEGTKSFISMGLASKEEIVGIFIIAMFRHEIKWSEDHIRRVKLIGEIIANALVRKRSRRELAKETDKRRSLENRYVSILKTANVGFWITDLHHTIIEVNDAYCAMTGYSREELLSRSIAEIDVDNGPEILAEKSTQILRMKSNSHETRHRCKDGSFIDVNVNSNLLEEEGVVYSFMRDITVLKRTRRDLENRLEFEELVSNFSTTLINLSWVEIDTVIGQWMEKIALFLELDLLTISEYSEDYTVRRMVHMYMDNRYKNRPIGVGLDRTRGFMDYFLHGEQIVFNRIPEDFPPDMDPQLAKIILADGTKCLLALPIRAGESIIGSITFASLTKPDLWKEELIRRLALIAEIISNAMLRNEKNKELNRYRDHLEQVLEEKTSAMKALQESEERFRSIFNGAMDGIMLSDPLSRQILMANNAMCQMLGYSEAELLQLRLDDIHPPDAFTNRVLNHLELMERDPLSEAQEMPILHKDSTISFADIASSLLEFEDKSLLIGVFRDVSDRRAAEAEKDILQKQLLQSQKMEAVGMLAGGVAHDFNNMLSVVIGYSELQMIDLDPDSDMYAKLSAIHSAAQRSAALVRQLLAFARKQTIEPKVLDFNKAIAAILDMLRHLIGEDIDLLFIPGHAAGYIKIDPTQIDQIMANLVVNARDAISDVGKITIETRHITLDDTYCAGLIDCSPGEYVQLIVSDDGNGMDQKTVEKIFEPFYSTKGLGEGTGLGLSTVYGIVKQNNGHINVYSEINKGTSFKLYFPRVDSLKDRDDAQSASVGRMPKGSETILIVEDDQIILGLGKTILQQLGYTVLCAGLPQEAIDLARAHAGKIDLLLTDVVMPQMNGKELAKQLTILKPGIRCLYMSGYTANVISHHGVLDEGVIFIQKPFTLNNLANQVRKALDAKGKG